MELWFNTKLSSSKISTLSTSYKKHYKKEKDFSEEILHLIFTYIMTNFLLIIIKKIYKFYVFFISTKQKLKENNLTNFISKNITTMKNDEHKEDGHLG